MICLYMCRQGFRAGRTPEAEHKGRSETRFKTEARTTWNEQVSHRPWSSDFKTKRSFSLTRQTACVASSNVRAKCGQIRILAEKIYKGSRYDTGKKRPSSLSHVLPLVL